MIFLLFSRFPTVISFWGFRSTVLFSSEMGVSENVVYPYTSEMGVSENSVPLNPMVNDHYPY